MKKKKERLRNKELKDTDRQTTAEKETLPSICPTGQGLRSHSPTLSKKTALLVSERS